MHDRDALDDFDAGKARIDIWGRSVLGDPFEDVLNGATVFDTLTVTGHGCGRMKGRAHEIAVARASTCDVAVHGASNGVMLEEISIAGRIGMGETFSFGRGRAGTPGAQTAPGFDFVAKGEDGVMLLVLAAVDGKSLPRLPAPDGAFAAIEVGGDLLPGLQSFLWDVPLRHVKASPRNIMLPPRHQSCKFRHASEKLSGRSSIHPAFLAA